MKNISRSKKVFIFSLISFSLSFLVSLPALAGEPGTVVISNGSIVTVSGEVISGGSILIRDGIISRVGIGIEVPEGAEVIDATGKWVTPGLIQSATDLATGEGYADRNSDETSSPNTAEMQITDAINPFDKDLRKAVISGVTCAMVSPGRDRKSVV